MKLSVIIPIFNKECTIARTVYSILKQGLNNNELEILLVDDGSSDNSLLICQKIADEYPLFVKVITKQNEGVGPTRNLGISISTGDFICFVDADDYLREGGFRIFKDLYFDEQFDVISYCSTTVKDGQKEISASKSIRGDIKYETTGHKKLSIGECHSFVWHSWYKKSFLLKNNIHFENFSYGEDLLFNINLFYANPYIRQTSSFIYLYVDYEENYQLSKIRDKDKSATNVWNFMKIYKRMGEISKAMKDQNIPCKMSSIFENTLITFSSRLLSSNISISQLRVIKKAIRQTQLMDSVSSKKTTIICRYIINSGYIFPLLKQFYIHLFVPFFLQRIDRETGYYQFTNRITSKRHLERA